MNIRKGYVIRDQYACYFLTFRVVGWIDIFSRNRYKEIVVDSFNFCVKEKALNVHSWVIMSNHVHCILSSTSGRLSDTIRDLKRHTSKQIIQSIKTEPESRRIWMLHQFEYFASRHKRNNTFQLWSHNNHPIELSGEMFNQRLEYIHRNPVKSGIVYEGKDYIYSSACDYSGIKGLIPISFIG